MRFVSLFEMRYRRAVLIWIGVDMCVYFYLIGFMYDVPVIRCNNIESQMPRDNNSKN